MDAQAGPRDSLLVGASAARIAASRFPRENGDG